VHTIGNFAAASTYWNDGKCSITKGESIALLKTMKYMQHRRIAHVIFETDSKSVVDAIHKLSVGNSDFNLLIMFCVQVQTLLSNKLIWWLICLLRRPYIGLVVVSLNYYLVILPLYYIIKLYNFLFVKK
jgi:hypothetical protein